VGVEEETSAHVLCKCEALATPRHTYLGSFFLEPKDVRSLSLGAQRVCLKGVGTLGPEGIELIYYYILF